MSGLIATPHVTQSEASIEIASDGWFPVIKLADVREEKQFDGTVTTARLRRAICYAVSQVNNELAAWKQQQIQASGAATMLDVASEVVDEKKVRVAWYFRAVACLTESAILEGSRGYDLTAEGQRRAEQVQARIDEARRDAFWATQDIQDLPHTVSGLV